MELFSSGADWWNVSSGITTLEVASNQLTTRMTLSDVSTIRDSLKRWNLSLDVALLALPSATSRNCGYHVEGFSAPGQSKADLQYLKPFRLDIKYFGMDEPLYYGHTFIGANACNLSIQEVAVGVADTVRDVRAVYPDAIIGDVEPIGTGGASWVDDTIDWLDAFKEQTGRELGFFRVDVQWNGPWTDQLRKLAPELKKRHIPLQVIFNGLDTATSDQEWVDQAAANFRSYVSSKLPSPDTIVFQFWSQHPSRALPSSDASTMTGLLKSYTQWKPLTAR